MPVSPELIRAIEAAVEQDPESIPLRFHLATLLYESGRYSESLEHCVRIISREPEHVDAVKLAAQCAEADGNTQRASAYRKLAETLETSSAKTSDSPELPNNSHPMGASVDGDFALRVVRGGQGSDDFFLETETPNLSLADVAGMEEVKRRLNLAFLAPLRNPELLKLYGKTLRGGLLLYGPPGCGKTFIARATAGELGARFINVGLSDVLDMYLGQSERNLHEIFETARKQSPCVLFFDEIDALGRKRSLMRHSSEHNIVNQLLSEMDNVNQNNEGVFILAASNHPWDVDTALRRPGRLDRTLLVLPPDRPAREAIFKFHLKDRPLENVDYEWLASKTDEYSGADIAHICETAAELAIENSLSSGKASPISMTQLKKALKEVKPSTRNWLEIARNYALFSNEGGTYDDLIEYLRAKKLV
jgi:SpoVK/Ycf46/Vps4 family AAA+-type ATPase